ncbi:MAG: hypothetical protein JHC26_08035 [Thermofilum sp.]|uniref:hypothetical protein n=1 Tax=Thermofilum sp. TaxID=1961369 RepID=UPI002586A294|nr:hypothetical protein [Thermofilum sp.]MCI4409027.1 hypothetical protein [Thermofilum sp.]
MNTERIIFQPSLSRVLKMSAIADISSIPIFFMMFTIRKSKGIMASVSAALKNLLTARLLPKLPPVTQETTASKTMKKKPSKPMPKAIAKSNAMASRNGLKIFVMRSEGCAKIILVYKVMVWMKNSRNNVLRRFLWSCKASSIASFIFLKVSLSEKCFLSNLAILLKLYS